MKDDLDPMVVEGLKHDTKGCEEQLSAMAYGLIQANVIVTYKPYLKGKKPFKPDLSTDANTHPTPTEYDVQFSGVEQVDTDNAEFASLRSKVTGLDLLEVGHALGFTKNSPTEPTHKLVVVEPYLKGTESFEADPSKGVDVCPIPTEYNIPFSAVEQVGTEIEAFSKKTVSGSQPPISRGNTVNTQWVDDSWLQREMERMCPVDGKDFVNTWTDGASIPDTYPAMQPQPIHYFITPAQLRKLTPKEVRDGLMTGHRLITNTQFNKMLRDICIYVNCYFNRADMEVELTAAQLITSNIRGKVCKPSHGAEFKVGKPRDFIRLAKECHPITYSIMFEYSDNQIDVDGDKYVWRMKANENPYELRRDARKFLRWITPMISESNATGVLYAAIDYVLEEGKKV